MDDLAVLVAENLKFDMVGVCNEFFEVDATVAEGFFGFDAGGMETLD